MDIKAFVKLRCFSGCYLFKVHIDRTVKHGFNNKSIGQVHNEKALFSGSRRLYFIEGKLSFFN